MENVVFEITDAHYSYLGKYPALNGVNLTVKRGESVAILGANGSGKSTLLNHLAGLVFADRGAVTAFGRSLTPALFQQEEFRKMFRSKVGVLFQNSEIQLFCPTVKEEILFGPLQLDIQRDRMMHKYDEVVGLLGIGHLLDRPTYHLSIGEKRRVAIASVLALDPDVLLLDEPTAGLDPRTCYRLVDVIRAQHRAGKTVVMTTHDIHIVREIADTIHIFSEEKRIVESGPTELILNNQDLLARYNLIHTHAHRHGDAWHVHPHRHPDQDHNSRLT